MTSTQMAAATHSTAVEIAQQVGAGTLDPTAAVVTALRRIAALNSRLGAFECVRTDEAIAEAQALSRRKDLASLLLAGVPIAVKDNIDVAGLPTRNGTRASPDGPSPVDHLLIHRLRAGGAIVIGKTRVPELCVFAASDGAFGIARNPWDLTRTCGGSSGGSAAAVAAGLTPIALGNDGLGSIRVPAACCGTFGLKPGTDLVPELRPNLWYGLVENGPLATTVSDAALLLAVLAARPDLARPGPERKLRIALSLQVPVPGIPLDPEFARAAHETAELLSRAGHTVEEKNPPYSHLIGLSLFAHWFAGTACDADDYDLAQLEPRTRVHVRLGRLARRSGLVGAPWRERWRALVAPFFADYDLLLTPGLAAPPIAAIEWSKKSWLANVIADARYAPFCASWNLAGFPAATVPVGFHSSGLPLSVQLVGSLGRERLILDLAERLEGARPWPRIAPLALDDSA